MSWRVLPKNTKLSKGKLMETKELIKFVKNMMKLAKKDMKQSGKYGLYEDVAYAEGAYNAYEVMLKKLQGED